MQQSIKQTHIEKMRAKFNTTPLLAPQDVRLILGLSKSTLNRMVKEGDIIPLCLNRKNKKRECRRFDLENVLDLFKKIIIK